MKTIPLTQGFAALVDDEDYERVSQHKWWASRVKNRYYAMRHVRDGVGRYRRELMHRFILDAQPSQQVDHIDGQTLNNTRANLRFATNTENSHNRGISRRNSSGYKGVSWHARHRKWRARINANGRHFFLGLFDTPEAAARAYDEAAKLHHGAFARTNF